MSKRKSFPGRGRGGGAWQSLQIRQTWTLRSWEKNYSIFFQDIDTGFFFRSQYFSSFCFRSLYFRSSDDFPSVHSFYFIVQFQSEQFFGKFFNSIVINLDLINIIYVFTQICNYTKLPFRYDNTSLILSLFNIWF